MARPKRTNIRNITSNSGNQVALIERQCKGCSSIYLDVPHIYTSIYRLLRFDLSTSSLNSLIYFYQASFTHAPRADVDLGSRDTQHSFQRLPTLACYLGDQQSVPLKSFSENGSYDGQRSCSISLHYLLSALPASLHFRTISLSLSINKQLLVLHSYIDLERESVYIQQHA